jgi:hypothetical protein
MWLGNCGKSGRVQSTAIAANRIAAALCASS